ncbi:hypothetical protein HRbin24_02147 [bacterium HR24]|nr:hypothetical protein HRbin24_02147 [bacterium HR24]
MNEFDLLRAAEEVARARWENGAAATHRRAALILRIMRCLAAFGEAAIAVSMAARMVGAADQERRSLLVVAAMASAALAGVAEALHLNRQQAQRLLDLCVRCSERRSIACQDSLKEIKTAILALAAEREG